MNFSQTNCIENNFDEMGKTEISESFEGDFSLAFEGTGSEDNSVGNCTGCGNKYFFAVKFAV